MKILVMALLRTGAPVRLCGREVTERTALETLHPQGPATMYFLLGYDKSGSKSLELLLSKVFPSPLFEAGGDCVYSKRTRVFGVPATFGSFDLSGALFPKRTLRFITILRDPLERLDASFTAYCQECNELRPSWTAEEMNTSRIIKTEGLTYLGCPNMSMTEYAIAFQDLYTRTFSHSRDPVDLSYRSTETDFDASIEWIQRSHPFIMLATDLYLTDKPFHNLGLYLDNDELRGINFAPHHQHHRRTSSLAPPRVFSAALVEVLPSVNTTYFAWDYKLLDWLRHNYHQPTRDPVAL